MANSPKPIKTSSEVQVTVKGLTKFWKFPSLGTSAKIGEHVALMKEGNVESGRTMLVLEGALTINDSDFPFHTTVTFEDETWGWAACDGDPGHPGLRDKFVGGAVLKIRFPAIVAVNWDGSPAMNGKLLSSVYIEPTMVEVVSDRTVTIPSKRAMVNRKETFNFAKPKGILAAAKAAQKAVEPKK